MPRIKGLRKIGYFDCPGGGQVYVNKGYAYVAKNPHAPREVAYFVLDAPKG